ncbi:uncharacterized protein LOC129943316 [Eupeodes corollae]|uniref:uncharacterized protein LOC129943316 n=1 Tax=Eupeodes corollae TaxID=290404 RepID=UPI00248F69B2|nr:uncharacterized protein LOC129943316 [Eupeodes corollae]
MLKNLVYFKALLPFAIFLVLINEIHGHGMMLDPVSRSSRWRYDKTAPINYDDNGLFCGGFNAQWFRNNGKCGLCGDGFDDPRPRANEIGGKYGQGVITKVYSPSQNAKLGIKITTNHLGFFYFHICNLDKFKQESEDCFSANKIKFDDGSLKMYIGTKSGMIYPTIVLPKGLTCKHCVLRWNYQAGNNWGPCGNGTSALGCGPQENFKGCSDISITKQSSKTYTKAQKNFDFYKSVWKNYIYNIESEFKEEQQKLDVFEQNLNRHIFRESEEHEESVPVYIDNHQLYKFEDGADYIVSDSDEIQERIPEVVEAHQSDKDIKLDFYDFETEQLFNNAIDDSYYDLE